MWSGESLGMGESGLKTRKNKRTVLVQRFAAYRCEGEKLKLSCLMKIHREALGRKKATLVVKSSDTMWDFRFWMRLYFPHFFSLYIQPAIYTFVTTISHNHGITISYKWKKINLEFFHFQVVRVAPDLIRWWWWIWRISFGGEIVILIWIWLVIHIYMILIG